MDIFSILYVALGGSLGAVARFLTSRVTVRYFEIFPMGTFLVNIIGSFLLGFVMFIALRDKAFSPDFRNFFAVGFIGSFTTMSTFAYESIRFWQLHEFGYFFLNISANVLLSLGAIVYGGYLATLMYR